jgi:succinate dehydrogenase / fumarate reductase membrane anchor subunit
MAVQTKKNEKSILWMLKQLSGVLVFILIFVHLIVNHFVSPNGLLSYQDVVRYLANPGIAVMEITFLIVVTAHSLMGVRSVILDFNPSDKAISIIDKVFIIVGIAAVIYGIILTLTIGGRL